MKHTLYILSLAAALIFSACNEIAVTPDSMHEPVKKVGLKIANSSYMMPQPNGALCVPVEGDYADLVSLATINPDGSYKLTEPFTKEIEIEWLYTNSAGEALIVGFYSKDSDYGIKILKIDKDGKIYDKGIKEYWPVTLFENGNIASFGYELIDSDDTESLVMRILDNNLTYIMEQTIYADYAFSYEDKIVLAEMFTGDYSIFKTDGSFVSSGSVNQYITNIKYVDGNLYFTTRNISFDVGFQDEKTNCEWGIHKIDSNGNIVYSTKIFSYFLYANYTVVDGNLIVTGSYINEKSQDEGYGLIYLINNENGQLIDKICVNYYGCTVLPLYVAPDNNKGFIIYALRQDIYDTNRQPFGDLKTGNIFIYNTKDLHALNINNTINQ